MHIPHHRLVNSLPFVLLLAGCGGATQEAPGANAPEPASAAQPAATGTAQPGADAADAQHTITAVLAGSHRSEENRARDKYRHPVETLSFFGVQADQTVVELWPGGGWYTEVLAPLLRERGKLIAAAPTGNYLQPYKDFLASRPELYDRVQLVELTPPDQLALGPDNSADVVLTFRNLHGWVGGGYAAKVHAAVFRVLKPGGVYGVVEHRAAPGTTAEQTKKTGYTPEDVAIQLATAAGLVLEARSEVNANPKDTKDYPEGVWTLPPVLRRGDVDRDKYLAIGESDRFTLRFRKPAQ